MASIDASHAATAAAGYLPIGQSHGPRQPTTSTSVIMPTSIVDTVELSPEGKAALKAGLAATRLGNTANSSAQPANALSSSMTATGLPFDHLAHAVVQGNGGGAIVQSAAADGEPASAGGTQDVKLLAEATLIGGLLDGNEEEEEALLG